MSDDVKYDYYIQGPVTVKSRDAANVYILGADNRGMNISSGTFQLMFKRISPPEEEEKSFVPKKRDARPTVEQVPVRPPVPKNAESESEEPATTTDTRLVGEEKVKRPVAPVKVKMGKPTHAVKTTKKAR